MPPSTRTSVQAALIGESVVDEERSPRARVVQHRARAKQLLVVAAERVAPDASPAVKFDNDAQGAPVPDRNWHWSKADTRGALIVAVANAPVGVDVERFGRSRLAAVATRFGDETRRVCGKSDEGALLAGWCAREAVLKKLGVGLAGLGRTDWIDLRVTTDFESLATIRFEDTDHCVRLIRRNQHLYAITISDLDGATLHSLPFSFGETL